MALASISPSPYLTTASSSTGDPFSSLYSMSPTAVVFFARRHSGGNHRRSIRAMAPDILGDFGARDPFPAEIASNFGEKVVGNESTEHRILIPNLSVLSLAQLNCQPLSSSLLPLSKENADKLLKKVIGWRLIQSGEGMKIQCTWRVRDYGCGIELMSRIYKALQGSKHYPDLHLEHPDLVMAELSTASVGGLSLNDFIVAAKIDQVKSSDLIPKMRAWA
ncbi:hypothetical protein KSP39_PZI018993 [Platanthera zijinensis]|uniref:4a-hydroxytetrahydrobiopterin dehydratase n=1 Tax=Platanthera zijinensis TaxID=2320716 RepID=A0AAP0FZ67_9ASPA